MAAVDDVGAGAVVGDAGVQEVGAAGVAVVAGAGGVAPVVVVDLSTSSQVFVAKYCGAKFCQGDI